jgi:hypothetical protein
MIVERVGGHPGIHKTQFFAVVLVGRVNLFEYL